MLENIEVTIYKSDKSASQSANSSKQKWKIRFPNDPSKFNYELMNWTGSKDMKQELDLTFENREQAIIFAEKNNWKYKIKEPNIKRLVRKSYDDNFSN